MYMVIHIRFTSDLSHRFLPHFYINVVQCCLINSSYVINSYKIFINR